ncbi:MAG: YmfQ family protein [Streptococcaceae bacterium]|jgi:hypothetical protein|nr:YmfQ family protein [Streptococcaceae bacterium]
MADTVRLIDLLPQPFYEDVYDMILLLEVQQYQLDDLKNAIEKAQKNFYAIVADVHGLEIFEEMLGIKDGMYSDIDSRRYNVIAAILPPQAITLRSFNEILQALNINATISTSGFYVQVDAVTSDSAALARLNKLLATHLPANMAYTAIFHATSSTVAPLKHAAGGLLAGKLTSKETEYAE